MNHRHLLILLNITLFSSSALAQVTQWTDGTGNWFTASNWNNGVPDITKSAEISNGGTSQIASAGAIADFVTLGVNAMETGTLSISGTGTLTTNNQSVIVGADGTGIMNITSGGSLTNNFGTGSVIAVGSSAIGTVTVDGTGSQWTNTGKLTVGSGGNGTLHISNGGTVSNTSITEGDIAASGHSTGLVTVDGTNSLWSLSSSLTVGDRGTGTLTITNGGKVSNVSMGIIGANVTTIGPGSPASAVGTVNVDGANSIWTNTGDDVVALFATGTMNITNGGTVSNGAGYVAGAPFAGGGSPLGAVTVDGMGSNWTMTGDLNVGFRGTGTLMITNKGAVSNASGVLGHDADTSGMATVDGAGSTWTNTGGLQVGLDGTGILHITNGGVVTNSFGQLGSNMGSNGTATIDGAGSTWTNAGTFLVGGSGTGMMTITNGGAVSSNISLIGASPMGDGTAIVDGAGSTWTTTSLYVGGDPMGPQGTGLLRVLHGGTVNSGTMTVWNTGTLEIGASRTLNTPITFDGGTLRAIESNVTFNHDLTLAAGGMRVETAALLTPTTGNTLTLSGVLSGPGGLFKFSSGALILTNDNIYTGITNVNQGSLIVDGSVTSNVFVDALLGGTGTITGNIGNGGVVSPGELGASAGTLTSTGNYTQVASATLRIEIGGLGMGQHDLLLINPGSASLAGTLQVLQLNGFIPHAGDSFTVLLATGGVSNEFDAVTSNFPGVLQPHAVYNPTFVDVVFVLGSFNVGGLTPNQLAIAHELNEVANDPLATDLIDALANVPTANLPHDYDLIAPEELASIYEIGFSQTVVQNMNLQHRMDDIRAGATGFCGSWQQHEAGKDFSGGKGGEMAPTGTVLQPAPDNHWGVFATGSGDFVNVDGDFNAHGYDITTGSVTVGADYRIGSHFAIGVDGGYSGSNADLVDNGEVEVDGGRVGGYATVYGFKILGSNVHVDGAVGGGWNSYDTHRTGLEDLPVRGSTNGSQFNAMVSYGADWIFGCLDIGTWSSIQYTDVSIDGFTETGSLAPLHIEGQDEDSLVGTTGMRVAYDWHVGNMIIRPEARAAWMHESNDRSYPIDAHLASGAGDTFTVHGPKIGRDAALVDAGIALQWNSHVSTYVYYDGVLGRSNYNNNSVSGGFRISF